MVPTVNSGSSDSTDVVISKREHTPLNHAAPSKEPKAPGWYKVVRILAILLFFPTVHISSLLIIAPILLPVVPVGSLLAFIGLFFLIKEKNFPLESIAYISACVFGMGATLFPSLRFLCLTLSSGLLIAGMKTEFEILGQMIRRKIAPQPKAPGWYKVVRILALIIFLPYAVLAIFLGAFCDHGTFCGAANLTGWFAFVTGLPLFIGLIFLIKSAIFPLESICYLIGFSLFPLVYIAALLNLIDPETPALWYPLFGFLLAGLIEIGALLWRVFRPSAKIAAVEKPVPAANINNSLQKSASASASSPNLTLSTKTITPLFQAVIDGDKAAIHAALAEDKEQINRPYAANGNTPLHVAVWNGHKDIVELLLVQDGIDTQAKNLAGKTALDLAVEKNFTDIIELLKFASR